MQLHGKRLANSRKRARKHAKRQINATCISFARVVSLVSFFVIAFCLRNWNFATVILPNAPAAEALSSVEIQKRTDSYNARRAVLGSNPSLYVSKTRLSIRQIPTHVTERMLKRLATHAIQAFDEEVASGSRVGLSEEEMTRDEPASDRDQDRNKGKAIPRVRQAKIVRQVDRVDALTGKGRSKGYGFLELREHADALRVLRWANNNPDVLSLLSEWWSVELADKKKEADSARSKRVTDIENRGSSAKQPRYSLFVEFSIENAQVVRRRAVRQTGVSVIPLEFCA